MSEAPENTTASQPTTESATPTPAAAQPLPDLMSAGEQTAAKAKPKPTAPDLEQQALHAAEAAIAEGERALAAARAQLQQKSEAPKPRDTRRELLLRGLLAFNVIAMMVVALLPAPSTKTTTSTETAHAPPTNTHEPPPPEIVKHREPYNRAMQAADAREFPKAVSILEDYLADSPRMAPGEQLNVLMALAYYAGRSGDLKKSQDYQRRADALEQSHSTPEDLVAMAQAALDSHDQDSLRRIWARFLLQQRQIPSWLYKHVAEAYLQLGDSYRQEATTAAEKVRLQQLEEAATKLRDDALHQGANGK